MFYNITLLIDTLIFASVLNDFIESSGCKTRLYMSSAKLLDPNISNEGLIYEHLMNVTQKIHKCLNDEMEYLRSQEKYTTMIGNISEETVFRLAAILFSVLIVLQTGLS